MDQRQLDLIAECRRYAEGPAPGLPAHNLMMIIAELDKRREAARLLLWKIYESDALYVDEERGDLDEEIGNYLTHVDPVNE